MADVDMYFAPCAAGFKCNFCDVTKDVKCNIRKHVRTSHYDRVSRRPERANPPEEFIRLGAKQLPDEALPASASPPGPSRSPTKLRSDPLAPLTSVALPPLTPEERQLVDQFISKDPTKHANIDGTFSTRSKFICNLCIKENLVRGFEKTSQDEVRRHIMEEHLEAIQKEKGKPKINRSVTRNDTRKIPNASAEPLFGIPLRTQAARPGDAVTLRRNPAPVVAPAKTTNVASAVAKRVSAVAPKDPVTSLPPLFSQPQPARVSRPRPEPLQPATPPAPAKPSTPASSPELPRGIPMILAGVIQSPVPKSPLSTPEKASPFRSTRPSPSTGPEFFPDQCRPSPANATPVTASRLQQSRLSRQKSQQTMESQKVTGTSVARRNSQPNLPRKTSTSSIDLPVNGHLLAASVNQQPKNRGVPPTGASGKALNERFSAPLGNPITPARPPLTLLPGAPSDELPVNAPGISLPAAEPPARPLTKARVESGMDPRITAEPVIAPLIPITAEGSNMLSKVTGGRFSVTMKAGAQRSGNALAETDSGKSRELSVTTVLSSQKTSTTPVETIVNQGPSAPQQNPSKRRRSRSPRRSPDRPQAVDDRLQSNGWACDETWENPSGADLPVPTDTSGVSVDEDAGAGITGTSLNVTAECSVVLSRLDIRVLRQAVVLPVGNPKKPVSVVSVDLSVVESGHENCTAVSRSVDSLELVQAVSSIEDSPIVKVSSVEDSLMVEVETAVVDIDTSAEQPDIISQSAEIPAVPSPQVQAVSGQDFVEISLPLKLVQRMHSQPELRSGTASVLSVLEEAAQGPQPQIPENPMPADVEPVVVVPLKEMAGINAEAAKISVVDARLNVAADGLFVCRKCWFAPEPEDVVLDHVIECFADSASEGGESGYLPEGSDISAVGLNREEAMDVQVSDEKSSREFSPEYQLATASSVSSNSPSLPPARTLPNNRSGRNTKKGCGRGQRRTRSRSTSSVTDDEERLWRTDIPGFEFSDDYKKLIIDASRSSGLSVAEMIGFFTPDLMEECRKDVKWVESLGLSGEPKQEPLDEPLANKNMK